MWRTRAQNAIREAARQGLLTVQERRHEGRRNHANVVRILLLAWDELSRYGDACRTSTVGTNVICGLSEAEATLHCSQTTMDTDSKAYVRGVGIGCAKSVRILRKCDQHMRVLTLNRLMAARE